MSHKVIGDLQVNRNLTVSGAISCATALTPSIGGTGLATTGTANQILGVVSGGGSLEYKTLSAGTGIQIVHSANAVTITNTNPNGGGSLPTRTTVVINAGSLASNATYTASATGYKSYALFNISTTNPAWVRVYANSASLSSDSSRTITTDPLPSSGVLAEVITSTASGGSSIMISPAAVCFNMESTPTTTIPCVVTNVGSATASISVTLTILQLES